MKNISNLQKNNTSNIIDLINYAIKQHNTSNLNTNLPAKIININNDGTYDVELLLQYKYENGDSIIPPPIHNVPAQVIRGGNAGIIIQYKVGDSVLLACCQRDITSIKKYWSRGVPVTYRKFSLSDSIIIGYLNKYDDNPTTFIKVTDDGIEVKSSKVNINSDDLTINTKNNININSDAKININSKSELNIKSDTTINIEAKAELKLKSTAPVTIESPSANINSSTISLGGDGGVGVLTGSTTLQVVGVQPGSATLPVTIVGGISNSVKAKQ